MKHINFVLLLASLIGGFISVEARSHEDAATAGKGAVRFNRDIRPILAENCFRCHGADPGSRKAKLRLDREEGFFDKRDEGPTVVKGKPDESPMYKHIVSNDPDEIMPPPKSEKKLKPEEKALIKRWIAEGAPWEPHWSFIKPERPELPKVQDEKWVRNPIDRFVLAKLEAAGLKPAPEASKRTLARRLSLDLTGLPPEPEMADAFDADTAPDAYEKLVDKLLASPRYGEHRARYWLDAARYADTHGLHFDNFRDIWPYRDWVINAFNANEPFSQFTLEQLAGDLLEKPSKEQLVATGFHRCNTTTNEGGSINDEVLANYARDRVETTSWVWLGLTANCAVCHDHKFDPITQKDFYSMSAFFRNTTQGAMDGNIRDTAPVMVMPKNEDEKRWTEIPKDVDAQNAKIANTKKVQRAEYDKWIATATPVDWDTLVDTRGIPALHLPLNEEFPDDCAGIRGVAGAHPVEAKMNAQILWEDGGKLGYKAPLLGENATLELPGDIGDFERDHAFSYGGWVKLPKDYKGSSAVMARMDDTAGFGGWDLYAQDNEFAAHLVNTWPGNAIKVATTGKQLKPGTWQHVFATYDGTSKGEGFKIFVDGKEAKLKIENNNLTKSVRTKVPLAVARRHSTSRLPGGSALQDLRIYDRRLSPIEVQRLAVEPKMLALLKKTPKDRSAKEQNELYDEYSTGNTEIVAFTEKIAALEGEKKAIRDRSPVSYIMEEKPNSVPTANILARGDYSKPKDKVEPMVFSALHPLPPNAPKNRLGLAQWLISPENPLTSRVIVNRFWQELFGTGIVKTSEDFGIMGDPPTHERLLDWLAVEFRDGGLDMKKTIKQIVMSATYRQSALATKEKIEKDPANRLMSRGPRFRMDAEMVRDNAIAASGLLSTKIGGPSVRPYQPDGVWDVVGMPESNTRHYKSDSGESLYRRSMYTFWKRSAPPASMEIFNATSRETSCIRRERTDTPLQALVTLNDPQYVEAARVLAQNALKTSADDPARLNFIARRVLARPFSEKEMSIVKKILDELLNTYNENPDDARALLEVGETKPDPKANAPILAAWTMVCNQILNLDEALNK